MKLATRHQANAMISFHESGAEFYARHGQAQLAAWSRAEIARLEKVRDTLPAEAERPRRRFAGKR